LPFGGSTVLSLTRGPAGNRTATGSLSAPQEWCPTNFTTRTTNNSKKHIKQNHLRAANNQATRRNEIIKSYLKHLSTGFKQQPICTPLAPTETKSSTKQLAPTDPILGPEKISLPSGSVQLYILSNFHTKRSLHDASGSKLEIVWPSILKQQGRT